MVKATRSQVVSIPLDRILPNIFQPRLKFDEAKLQELADSIRQYGVLQPIVIRERRGKYEVVAGERRVRACRMLGLQTIPAVVGHFSDAEVMAITVLENVQREGLAPEEKARALSLLYEHGKMEQVDFQGQFSGKPDDMVEALGSVDLPLLLKEALKIGIISKDDRKDLESKGPGDAAVEDVRWRFLRELLARELRRKVERALAQGSEMEDKMGIGRAILKAVGEVLEAEGIEVVRGEGQLALAEAKG